MKQIQRNEAVRALRKAERLARCQDTLELLFGAAARAAGDPPRQRLPGLMDSFMQWCESAREDSKLGPAIDEELGQRRFRTGMTQEYRDWRAMARGNPAGLKAAGHQDDPSRGDKEKLRLELERARLGTGAEHEAAPAGGDDTGAGSGGRQVTGNEK